MRSNGRTQAAAPTRTLKKRTGALIQENGTADDIFERIFNLSPYRMGIVRMSDGVVCAINDRLVAEMGYSREETIGHSILDFQLSDDLIVHIKEMLHTKKPIRDFEGRVTTKAGEERMIVTSVECVEFDGEPCFLWATNDVTEQKRTEAALRRNEELFRAIVEDQTEMIVRWKPDGTRTFVNQAYARVFGGKPEDYIGTNFFPLIHEEFRERIRQKILSITPEQPLATAIHQSLADGEIRWQEWTDRGIFNQKGELVELQSTGRDITERVKAEEELRTSEERFSKAFSLGPHRMGIIRLSDGLIVDVNDRWVQETGLARADVVGHSILDVSALVHGDANDRVQELLEAGKPFRDVELTFSPKTGKKRIVLSSGEVFDLHNEPCLLFAANDITERKQVEERIRLLQKITMDVAAAEDLSSALGVVLRDVCEMTGWALGQAWLPNEEENTLTRSSAWYASTPDLAYFREATVHFEFRPGDGLLGRVWQSKEPAWVRDVPPANNCPRAQFATDAGLKAGVAVPILSGEEVIAVLEFFLREPRDEDEQLVHAITAIAAQLGMVVRRKRVEDALRSSEQQLRALAVRLRSAREEEGTRIAREIHDELGGTLTGLKWDLERLEKLLANPKDASVALEKIPPIISVVDSTIDTVRRISSELRPGVLDDLGLVPAIEWQTQQFEQRTGIHCSCSVKPCRIDLGEAQATAIFRVFQEVLTNVLRHAEATSIDVNAFEEGKCFVLEVKDNGRGITGPEKTNIRSLGLLGMQERIQLIGGSVQIDGVPGEGTRVKVCVPIE
ncbi:MAG TPA: PAS domain S-box protein [Pyrinomonadaceae bacterium]|nr:PAS domain S-box protein [Pyrinomonadaceae bacterium]